MAESQKTSTFSNTSRDAIAADNCNGSDTVDIMPFTVEPTIRLKVQTITPHQNSRHTR